MTLSIMLTLLLIKTDYSFAVVKLNEIQAIEAVDRGLNDGGILTITLRGDKSEQIVYAEDDINKWNDIKKWLDENIFNLSSELSKKDTNYLRNIGNKF